MHKNNNRLLAGRPKKQKAPQSSVWDALFVGKRTKRLGKREWDIIDSITAGDLLVGALLSARSSKRMHQVAYRRARDRYNQKQAFMRLKKAGLIQVDDSGSRASLTLMGRLLTQRRTVRVQHGARWDGYWRIVSFDVPQEYKHVRNVLRRLLNEHDFKKVQGSVYVSPYPKEELVTLLQNDSRLSKYIFYARARNITNEAYWKIEFKLQAQ